MLQVVLILVIFVLWLTYYILTNNFDYWKKRGVKFMKPYPVTGSIAGMITLREHQIEFYQRAYYEAGNEACIGYFLGKQPFLILKDLDLIKTILVKDFSYFTDHNYPMDEEVNAVFAKNLFNMCGKKWKDMRIKLSPTFTSGRIKAMFPLVLQCAEVLENYIGTFADTDINVDIKDILARYTTDVIASCVFGVKRDSINDPKCQFRMMGRRLLDRSYWSGMKNLLVRYAPWLSKKLRLSISDDDVTTFFQALVKRVISLRATTGETRKDFMQLLIELKEKGRLSDELDEDIDNFQSDSKLTEEDITAQAVLFFLAGFDTSSSAVTFALFEMTKYPEIQRKARRHIEEVLQRHNGQVTYQALEEMTYLDCILQESLRMYPPLPHLTRICVANYLIPGTNINIEAGTKVMIPIHSIQNDPAYVQDPGTFNPESFENENLQNLPFYQMPFGEGPRKCIGMRFGRIQSKLGLMSVLRKFEVTSSTRKPLSWDPRVATLKSKETILMKLTRVKKNDEFPNRKVPI